MNIFPIILGTTIGCLAGCGVVLTATLTYLEVKKLIKNYNEDAE